MKKRHINLPIFIPHLGCPNACVFCNQRSISGKTDYAREKVADELEKAFRTVDPARDEVEIAFFGGSFTGIDRGEMLYLLALTKPYLESGQAVGIRLSTRPDYIDGEILSILSSYGVTDIELGIQSMDDGVLRLSGRGHTAEQSEKACRMIKAAGFRLVGQMMIGLPGSDGEKEKMTAKKLIALACDGVRVYPTVVFAGTELARMYAAGEYEPLTAETALERTVGVVRLFKDAGIPILRIGLCAAENLSDEEQVLAGGYHSAFGELVIGELYYLNIKERLLSMKETLEGKTLMINVPRGDESKAAGQQKRNKRRLTEEFGFSRILIKGDAGLSPDEMELHLIREK